MRLRFWLLSAILLWPAGAGATFFSFGEIEATDEITAIRLAADSGSGTTIDFTAVGGSLVLEASVAQFDFANKPAITGIPTGDVILVGTVYIQGSPSFVPPFSPFPTETYASFDNGVIDWSIWDVAGGGTAVLKANFLTTLDFSASKNFLLQGELTGLYAIVGGDADAMAAFGSQGDINASINFGSSASVCGTLALSCPFPAAYKNWSGNPTMTLRPVETPEPAALGLLASAALAAALARRRARA